MKHYYVYTHINIINWKVYVGITTRDPKIRWNNGNGYLLKIRNKYSQPKFANAIIKYGWKNFIHNYWEVSSKDEMLDWERYLIDYYDSTKNGYNSTTGGEHPNFSEETKIWMEILRNLKKYDPVYRKRNSSTSKKHKRENKTSNKKIPRNSLLAKLGSRTKTILIWMCKNAQFNTGKVSLTTQKRKDLAKELNITPQTLSNSLTALKKSNLINGNNGEFQINPQIFWKGSQESREALLQNKAIIMTFSLGEEDPRDKIINSFEKSDQ